MTRLTGLGCLGEDVDGALLSSVRVSPESVMGESLWGTYEVELRRSTAVDPLECGGF